MEESLTAFHRANVRDMPASLQRFNLCNAAFKRLACRTTGIERRGDLQVPLPPTGSLESGTDADLIGLYGEVMIELRRRGIVRSANNPIVDIAERLIATHYGVEPER